MYTYSSVFESITLQIILIVMSVFMTACQGRNPSTSNRDKIYCPFIETLSFSSDIHIQCNNSHLIFNEINNNALHWKFADQTATCKQNGTQQASINQCGIRRIGLNHLKVPLKSSKLGVEACAYCRINSKPITPLITVTHSDVDEYIHYTFNITTTELAHNESLEIVWAKRANGEINLSVNYWFLPKCIYHAVKIRQNTPHTIIFTVDDIDIHRVEFIVRRCDGTCRTYDICDDDAFHQEAAQNYIPAPDSIEKISCDSDCLDGVRSTRTTTTQTHISPKGSSITSSTNNTPSKSESTIIVLISLGILVLLLIISLIVFITYMLCRRKEETMYAKTSHVDPDEHK